jgi:hypothetical protein
MNEEVVSPSVPASARLSALWRFALMAMCGVVLFTLAWSQVARWAAYPAALLTKVGLEAGAAQWVRGVQVPPGAMVTLDTSVAISTAQTGGRLAEIVLDAEPGRYAYGLPIFLALMAAAAVLQRHSPGRGWRVLAGYALMLPAQAFSLGAYLLMQLLMATQMDARILRISQGQMEGIVYAYQLGALVLPTLVPVLVWLWLERRFVEDVLVRAWRESLQPVAERNPVAEAASALPTAPLRHVAPTPPTGPVRPAEISTSASLVLPTRKEPGA